MIVTRLEEIEKSKVRVYLDDTYAFFLYHKELEQLGIKEGTDISPETYEKILADIIYRRSKKKALEVLKFMDRTEQELKEKLAAAGYPENMVERTIAYVKEYGYLDDTRFASAYVRARMHEKSRLVIKTELLHKGIPKNIIDHIFQDEYENSINNEINEDAEITAIKRNVAKKTKSPETLSAEEKKKLMASLYRKGFDIEKIKKVIG